MFSLRALIPVLATSVLLVVPAEATTSYYAGAASGTQEASFNTAVGTLTLMNPSMFFAAGDLGSGGLFNASGTGIDFLGYDDYNFNDPLDFVVTSGHLKATVATQQATINFPAGLVYALGFHITMNSGTNANWCIELTHGTCNFNLFNSTPSSVQFFGVVSTTPINTSLFIRNQGGSPTLVLNDFAAYKLTTSETGSEVPEPHTLLLAGFGLAILGVMRRKIQRAG
jgi:hypothetical protein